MANVSKMLTLKVLNEYVNTDAELFRKKIAKFSREKINFGKIFHHILTMVLVLGQLFSPFFYNLDNNLET